MDNSQLHFSTEMGSPATPTIESTIISIVPFQINEFKPGLIPGQFDLEACLDSAKPVVKTIAESIYYVWIDPERGNLRVTSPSYQIAKSVCDDYNSAQIAATIACHPGLFWLLGRWTSEQIVQQHPDLLAMMTAVQMRWFMELCRLADDDWEKTRQHFCISDTQRYAAKAIDPTNSRQRPWVMVNPLDNKVESQPIQTCGACGSDVPVSAVICRYCSCVLDAEKYAAMQFAGGPTPTSGMDLGGIIGRATKPQ